MSVNTKVTVPLGSSAITRSYAQSPRHVKGVRPSWLLQRGRALVSRRIAATLCCSLSTKGAVAAHRFDRPLPTEMDEKGQWSGYDLAAERRGSPRTTVACRQSPTARGWHGAAPVCRRQLLRSGSLARASIDPARRTNETRRPCPSPGAAPPG